MPHTTRKTYKSKLIEKNDNVSASTIDQIQTADKIYTLLDKESSSKQQVHRLVLELAMMSLDVIRCADKYTEVGHLKYIKVEEINDDQLHHYDIMTILDRVFDTLMMSEERITTLSEGLTEAVDSQHSVRERLASLTDKLGESDTLQRELYDVGKSPSTFEIEEFEQAESRGEKYTRTFANRSLQTHQDNFETMFDDSVVDSQSPAKEVDLTTVPTPPATPQKKEKRGKVEKV